MRFSNRILICFLVLIFFAFSPKAPAFSEITVVGIIIQQANLDRIRGDIENCKYLDAKEMISEIVEKWLAKGFSLEVIRTNPKFSELDDELNKHLIFIKNSGYISLNNCQMTERNPEVFDSAISYSKAKDICEKKGGRLPSYGELEKVLSKLTWIGREFANYNRLSVIVNKVNGELSRLYDDNMPHRVYVRCVLPYKGGNRK